MHRCVLPARRRGWHALPREIGLLALLYVGYTAGRLFAADDVALAREHGRDLVRLESGLGLDIEHAMNTALSALALLEVAAAYCYASLHYIVTPVVLIVLWRRAPASYARWRWVLVIATAVALAGYLDPSQVEQWAGVLAYVLVVENARRKVKPKRGLQNGPGCVVPLC